MSFAPISFGFGKGHERFGIDAGTGYAVTLWYGLLDALLLLGIVAGSRTTFYRFRKRVTSRFVDAGVLLVLGLAISSAIHPVDRGVSIVLRLLGVVVATDWYQANEAGFARTLTRALCGIGIAQWLLVAAQRMRGGKPVGLFAFGERPIQRFPFGPAYTTMGTLAHPYMTACFVVTCASVAAVGVLRGHVSKWVGGIVCFAASSVAILNLSRVAVLGITLMTFGLTMVWFQQKRHRKSCVVLAIAFIAGAGLSYPFNAIGWTFKVRAPMSAGVDTVSSHRLTIFKENIAVLKRNPIVGVGTGRYAIEEVEAGRMTPETPYPPHNVILSALCEAGLLSVPSLLVHGWAILDFLRKRNWIALIPVFWLASPIMLEQFMWNSPEGMLMVGLSLGVTTLAERKIGDRPNSGSHSIDTESLVRS